MKRLQIIILVLIAFLLLPLALIPIAEAEARLVWGFHYEGMVLDIYAPYQGYAGKTITVRIRVEAKEDLRDVYVYVVLRGSKGYGYESWASGWYHLYDVDLSPGVVRDEIYIIAIPSDVDSGLVYGHAKCRWEVRRFFLWFDRLYEGSFNVVYLRNLLDEYGKMKTERDYWKGEHDKMKTERDYARQLNFILTLTTVVFIATTTYFAIRKRKVKPELKAT